MAMQTLQQGTKQDTEGGYAFKQNCNLCILSVLACEEGPGVCAHLITGLCLVLIVLSLPLSLCMVVKVVQVASLGTVQCAQIS